MLFAISPDVFDRIQFRGIGWQTLQMDVAVLLRNIIPDQAAAVRGQTIPDDREPPANVLLEVLEKLDHLRGLDAAGKEPKVEIPNGDACDGRKTVPVEGILQSQDSREGWADIADQSRFVGGQRIYTWRQLEPKEGKYDFSAIEADLAYLHKQKQCLILEIWDTTFQNDENPAPDYLLSGAAYKGGIAHSPQYPHGARAKRWVPAVCHKLGMESFPGTGDNGVVKYLDGIWVGYRHFDEDGIEPRFPFGYGLSYTTFKYGKPVLSASTMSSDKTLAVSIPVTNTGKRAGAEVVELYIHEDKPVLPRPPQELKGFTKLMLRKRTVKCQGQMA